MTTSRCNIGFIWLLVAASQLATAYAQISREYAYLGLPVMYRVHVYNCQEMRHYS